MRSPIGMSAGEKRDLEVVEDVGGLLGHTLVGLAGDRAGDLVGLLADLLPDQVGVGEQLGRVRALRALGPAGGERPLELRQGLVGDRRGIAADRAVEAGPLTRMAGGAGRVDERQHGVGVAVVAELANPLDVARTSRPCARARRGSGSTGATSPVSIVLPQATRH